MDWVAVLRAPFRTFVVVAKNAGSERGHKAIKLLRIFLLPRRYFLMPTRTFGKNLKLAKKMQFYVMTSNSWFRYGALSLISQCHDMNYKVLFAEPPVRLRDILNFTTKPYIKLIKNWLFLSWIVYFIKYKNIIGIVVSNHAWSKILQKSKSYEVYFFFRFCWPIKYQPLEGKLVNHFKALLKHT